MSHIAARMSHTLYHRGPDDDGQWVDASVGLALGYRRLAIVDLSPTGRQPMHSPCGRYVIVFNGEIYNFQALRRELEGYGYSFRGHSDTEVMLLSISHWGLNTAVTRFVGMFAFALWDRKLRRLHLVRDRMGEKPLYYGWMGNAFLFGSELKALRAHPGFQGEVDLAALALYFRHNYIPAPYSIYRYVYKLPPGTILTVESDRVSPIPVLESYWSLREVSERGSTYPLQGTTTEALDRLEITLGEAVKLQMQADVPLGAFLSGGVDSSTIVALMQAQSTRAVKTFTIGFQETEYDEAQYARAVAHHLGTDHTELYVTPAEAMAVIPQLPRLYDEPFADSSQIPTFLVAKLARQQVTVSLSGDAGDELFGGYHRYFLSNGLWKRIGWIPRWLRLAAARTLVQLPPGTYDALAPWTGGAWARIGDKVHKLANLLGTPSSETMYHAMISYWQNPRQLVPGAVEPSSLLGAPSVPVSLRNFVERMMYLDAMTYLPDDILVKVDRAAMGASLESRVPFLDHRVVELAWGIPLDMKIRHGKGKWLLREVLYRHVPRELIERPKRGFGIPIGEWLRGPLRDWAEELLDEERLRREGFLDPRVVRQKWHEHLSAVRNWQHQLWGILMFQAWLADNQ